MSLSVLLLVPVGFSMMTQMASSNTLIQAMVPDRLRGRTMAVYSMMFMGMAPIGALLAGAAGGSHRRAVDGGDRRVWRHCRSDRISRDIAEDSRARRETARCARARRGEPVPKK